MPTLLRCWGVRGSVPVPGPATARYGGNTPCLELEHEAGRLVLDAGTGIRALGDQLRAAGAARSVDVLVTHAHADHLHGLPFFALLDEPGAAVTLHVAPAQLASVEAALGALAGPPLFPVPLATRAARMRVQPIDGGCVELGPFRARVVDALHPGGASGFRVEDPGGAAVVYLPDNELAAAEGECGRRRAMLEAIAGASLLVHDATYLPAELPRHRGWGHSTYAEAIRLAADAGVPRLMLFHHHPERTDDALDRLAAVAGPLGRAARGAPEVFVAREGLTVTL